MNSIILLGLTVAVCSLAVHASLVSYLSTLEVSE